MSQFALPNYPRGPFYECIAVSQTPDPLGAWHRLGNRGTEDLVLLELQRGDYCGEDDIERRADDYGRISAAPAP